MKDSNNKARKKAIISILLTILVLLCWLSPIAFVNIASYLPPEVVSAIGQKLDIIPDNLRTLILLIWGAGELITLFYYLFISTKCKNKYFLLRKGITVAWLLMLAILPVFESSVRRLGAETTAYIAVIVTGVYQTAFERLTNAERNNPEAIVGLRRKR